MSYDDKYDDRAHWSPPRTGINGAQFQRSPSEPIDNTAAAYGSAIGAKVAERRNTPLVNVIQARENVYKLESRISALADKLAGYAPEGVGVAGPEPEGGGLIRELSVIGIGIQDATARAHAALDRIEELLP